MKMIGCIIWPPSSFFWERFRNPVSPRRRVCLSAGTPSSHPHAAPGPMPRGLRHSRRTDVVAVVDRCLPYTHRGGEFCSDGKITKLCFIPPQLSFFILKLPRTLVDFLFPFFVGILGQKCKKMWYRNRCAFGGIFSLIPLLCFPVRWNPWVSGSTTPSMSASPFGVWSFLLLCESLYGSVLPPTRPGSMLPGWSFFSEPKRSPTQDIYARSNGTGQHFDRNSDSQSRST